MKIELLTVTKESKQASAHDLSMNRSAPGECDPVTMCGPWHSGEDLPGKLSLSAPTDNLKITNGNK